MALGRGNIEIDVRARGLTQDVVRQVQDAERKIRPLSVTLNDKGFRQPLGRITGDLAEFQKSLDASVARTLAFGAAVGVLNAVTNGFKAMISSAVEVEKSLTDVNVILNLNAKALENFSSQLFNTAKNTGQSFQTVSEAAVELSRQGLGAEETLKRINDAMILTRLSGMDAAKSVETLTAAINGFGSAALTTTELVNKLATVDAAFAVSTEDLSNALARAGSTAQGAKVSLDELLAAVTSVQQQTARGGSVIGNAFKSIFTRIQRSGVREALEEIGVATQDSTGNIRGALDILKDYARVYGTLSDAQRAYTDELVAGVFQINNLKALVKDLSSDYSIYQRALNQSNDATDEAVKRNQELQGTLSALINEASVNAKELASSLGELVATPAVENLLKLFNNLAGALNEALDPDKGSALIKGMFSAIGRFIAGPGLVLMGAAFIKLFKFITTQSLQAVKEVFKIGDASNRIADTQAKITFLLKDNQALYQAISNEALTHEQREEIVLETIKSQNAAYAQQQAMIDRLARSRTIGTAIRGGEKNRASGYIPNFANGLSGAINAEKQAISLGTGGASKGAKPKVLKSFPMGRGKKETIVANTDEVIVPNYGGGSGSAIFNQEMIKKAGGVPQGAIPVSQGYMPNFAKGKRGIDKGGKSIKDSKIWRNATDGYPNLSVDAESIGGFGMISIKGSSGRFNQQKKINPFGSSYLGTEKGKEIIDEIAGSRLTAQDKQIVLSKIQKLGGGVLGVSFQNMGGATFSELNGARASDFAGQKGAFNNIIGGSIAQATADISARIYGRLFGDEVKANQLVSSVIKEADRSQIVSVDAEGSIFEAAVRLGSKASTKTFGTNSGRGAWDFEETSNISPDLKRMFFDSVGYSEILRADAKRVGSPTAETEVINKAYRTPFFREALERIHKQQYTPLVQKAIQAKNDTSKAQGYIPNFAKEKKSKAQIKLPGISGAVDASGPLVLYKAMYDSFKRTGYRPLNNEINSREELAKYGLGRATSKDFQRANKLLIKGSADKVKKLNYATIANELSAKGFDTSIDNKAVYPLPNANAKGAAGRSYEKIIKAIRRFASPDKSGSYGNYKVAISKKTDSEIEDFILKSGFTNQKGASLKSIADTLNISKHIKYWRGTQAGAHLKSYQPSGKTSKTKGLRPVRGNPWISNFGLAEYVNESGELLENIKKFKIESVGSLSPTVSGRAINSKFPGIARGSAQSFQGLRPPRPLTSDQKANFFATNFKARINDLRFYDPNKSKGVLGKNFLQRRLGWNEFDFEDAIDSYPNSNYKKATAAASPLDFTGDNLAEAKYGKGAKSGNTYIVGKLLRHILGSRKISWGDSRFGTKKRKGRTSVNLGGLDLIKALHDGFIPSFAGLSQLEHFQKYSYGRHGKTLDLRQFFPKSGTAAIGNLFKDVIDKAKAGDPYEKIVAGEIVGPRIPKMILRAKKTLDRARATGLEQPKMRIEGRFDPGDLMASLTRNKGLYEGEKKTAKILGKKFEPSRKGVGIKKKSLASKYVPGETGELARAFKEMGIPGPYDKPGRTFYLADLPIFSKGFAGGYIPNFQKLQGMGKHSGVYDARGKAGARSLNIAYLSSVGSSGPQIFKNLLKQITGAVEQGNPYTEINAGEVVGPRIPTVILKAKRILDRQRASGKNIPFMNMRGVMDPPARLLEKLRGNKKGLRGKTSSVYIKGEERQLLQSFKELGLNPKSWEMRDLDTIPMLKNFSEGFIPNFANSLEEAIVREKDALASQRSNAKIYVDQDNRLRDPKNPMGLLVANTRDEPLSGSQGVNRAIGSGINPKNKGAIDQMAGGYVPNFAIGATLNIGRNVLQQISRFGSSIKNLGGIFGRTSKNADDAGKATGGFFKQIGGFLGFTLLGEGLTKLEEATGKSTTGINIASTALFTDMSKTKKGLALLGGALFDFRGTIGEFLGFGPDTDRLTAAFEKYGEVIDNQINKIEQNIEKVDKFATTLSSLNKAAGSRDIKAYGKFLQQTLDQAGELEGLDVDLVQNLIGSTGNVEEFNEAIKELKRSTEQAKGIKTFSKDITELSKKVLEAGSFIEAGISEDEIRSLGQSLTKNLNTDQIDDFAKSLQGIGGLDSEQAKEKLLGLQSVIGEFDDVTKSAILSGGALAQELLKVAKGQIEYKKATQDVIDSYKDQLKPVKNLASSIKQLALAAENATRASTAAYKALSETAKIQAGSRVERLRATGTVSEGDLLKGQASADLIKVSQDSSQEINTALRGFVTEILKQGKDGDLVLKGTTKDIIDNLSKGNLSTQDALNSLITLQADAKSFEKENQELISKTISSIQGASNTATIERRKIQATLAAQLAAQENAAIALNRNVSVTEQQLDVLSGLGKGDSKSLQAIDRQTSAIEALINRGSDPKLLNPLLEELKQQRQTLNLKEQFRALAAGTGAKFDAEGLVTLERQVNDFIDSDSFGKLSQVNQQAIIASKKQIDLAKQAQREGGAKGVGDVAKAADTLISQASIGELSKELSKVMSDSLAKGLNIDDATLAKLNETFSDIPSLVNVISQTSQQNAEAIENNNKIEKKLNEALISSIQVSAGEQLDAAGKLENAATALQNAAAALQGHKASGFVPNFAPNPVSRALNTESKMGAKRPVVDSHPSIGSYVRDGATQPNFSAVRRDHPEGINKAISNSARIQGAARGFIPNFAEPEGGLSLGELAEQAFGKDPKRKRVEEYLAGGGKTTMKASKFPGWNSIKKEIYRQTGLGKEDPFASDFTVHLDAPPDYKVLGGGTIGAFDPTTQKLWLSEFPTKDTPRKALAEIQSTLANESIHWIQAQYKQKLGGMDSKEYQQWVANTTQKQDKALGGVGFGGARYAKSFDDIGIEKAGSYQEFLEGKKFSEEEVLKRFDIKDIKNLPGLDEMMEMGTPAEAWLANDLRFYAPGIMDRQAEFWKSVGLTHKKAMGLSEISKSVGGGVDRLRKGYLIDTAPTAWPKFKKTGDPRDLQVGPDLLGIELDMFLNDPDFREYWFDEKGNSKFLKDPQGTLKALGEDVDTRPLVSFMKNIQSVFEKKEGSDQLGYEALREMFTEQYNMSIAKLLGERMSHMASIGVRNLQKQKGGNEFAPLAGGFIPNFAKLDAFQSANLPRGMTASMGHADIKGLNEFYRWALVNRPNWTPHEASKYYIDQSKLREEFQFGKYATGTLNLLGGLGEAGKSVAPTDAGRLLKGYFFGELQGLDVPGGFPRSKARKVFNNFNLPNHAQSIMGSRLMNLHETGVASTEEELNKIIFGKFDSSLRDSQSLLNEDVKQNLLHFLTFGEGAARLSAYDPLIGGTGGISATADTAVTALTLGRGKALTKGLEKIKSAKNAVQKIWQAVSRFSDPAMTATASVANVYSDAPIGGVSNLVGAERKLAPEFQNIISDASQWMDAGGLFQTIIPRAHKDSMFDGKIEDIVMDLHKWYPEIKKGRETDYSIKDLISEKIFDNLRKKQGVELKSFDYAGAKKDTNLFLEKETIRNLDKTNIGPHLIKNIKGFPNGKAGSDRISEFFPRFSSQYLSAKGLYDFNEGIKQGKPYPFPAALEFVGQKELSNVPQSYTEGDIDSFLQRLYQNKEIFNDQKNELHKGNRGEDKRKQLDQLLGLTQSGIQRALSFKEVIKGHKETESFSLSGDSFVTNPFYYNQDSILGNLPTKIHLYKTDPVLKKMEQLGEFPDGRVTLPGSTNQRNSFSNRYPPFIESLKNSVFDYNNQVDVLGKNAFPEVGQSLKSLFQIDPESGGAQALKSIEKALGEEQRARLSRVKPGDKDGIVEAVIERDAVLKEARVAAAEGRGIFDKDDVRGQDNIKRLFDTITEEREKDEQNVKSLRDKKYKAILGSIDQASMINPDRKTLEAAISRAKEKLRNVPEIISNRKRVEESWLKGDPPGLDPKRQNRIGLYSQLQAANERGQDTKGLSKRIAGHEEAIRFFDSELAKYGNPDDTDIATLLFTDTSAANAVRVGPNNRLLKGFYNRPNEADALKKLLDLKKKYKIGEDDALKAVIGEGEITNPFEYLTQVAGWTRLSNDEKELDTLYAKMRQGGGILNGQIFKKEFEQANQQQRIATMMKLGIRSENKISDLPGEALRVGEKDLGFSISNLKEVFSKSSADAPISFLLEELSLMSKDIKGGLEEAILSKQIKDLNLPFVHGEQARTALQKKMTKVFLELGREGQFEEHQVKALEDNGVRDAINFITRTQLDSNLKELSKRDGDFSGIESALLATHGLESKEKLMQTPLYLKFLKDKFNAGRVADSKIDGYLTEPRNVDDYAAFKALYGNSLFGDVIGNTNYGKVEYTGNVDNNAFAVNQRGNNPFAQLMGQARIDTEEKMLDFFFEKAGGDLYFGRNRKLEEFIYNSYSPFKKLPVKDWKERSLDAAFELFGERRNLAGDNFKNYAPFGYDLKSKFKTFYPPWAADTDLITRMFKLVMDYGPDGQPNAKGFIPNFSKVAGEISASRIAGYKSPVTASQVKSINIPGVGKSTFNTQESVFKASGMSQPFIVPPANSKAAKPYAKQVQRKFNFNPYGKRASADGFIPNFAPNGNGFDFSEMQQSIRLFEEATLLFSKQSEVLKSSANSFQESANKISELQNQEPVNFERLTSAASKIEISFDKLSSNLNQPLEINSSSIETSMDNLAIALSNMQASMTVSIPDVNVNINGAAQITDSISSLLQAQIPQLVQNEISKMNLATKFDIGMN